MNRTANIIKRFGGIRPMARLLSVPPSTIHTWKSVDRIPAQQQQRVLECGQALDPPLAADDFFAPAATPPQEAEAAEGQAA